MCGDPLIGTTVLTRMQSENIEVLIVNDVPKKDVIEMKIEITEIVKRDYYEPKKLHPKHQRGNKYRFNK